MAQGLSSAAGLLALLEEPEISVKEHALKKLNDVVDVFWPEIADANHTLYAMFLPTLLVIAP